MLNTKIVSSLSLARATSGPRQARGRGAMIVAKVMTGSSQLIGAQPATSSRGRFQASASSLSVSRRIGIRGIHHVAVICENLEKSLEFYCGILGLEVNPDRPNDKLPYRGAWLWLGPEMIHLMELPNPDPLEGRPDHGGRDRHFCIGVDRLEPLEECLKEQGIEYTKSKSGRPALFFRDPDSNTLEVVEIDSWRVVGPGNNVEANN